jgi:nucleoside-diphosphate-sugar epimerase
VGDALDVGALPARPGDPPRLVPDVNRLFQEIGFKPAMDFDEGLRNTIKWWRMRSAEKYQIN